MSRFFRIGRCLSSAVSCVGRDSAALGFSYAPPQVPPACWTPLGTLPSRTKSFASISASLPGTVVALEAISGQKGKHRATQGEDGEPELVTYHVEVVTGSPRGAGTNNPCTLQVFGNRREGLVYLIGDNTSDSQETGFSRDSIKLYSMTCPELGALRRIHLVKSVGSVTELGSGWFLDRITITDPDGLAVTFPCYAWLGESDDGDKSTGEHERNLIPLVNSNQVLQPAAPVNIVSAGLAIPHPDKVKQGMKGVNQKNQGYAGEDAYFYTHGNNEMFGMGVADGIYSWRARGIDSGIFSRTLMETALHMIEAGYSDVLKVVQIAGRKVQSEGVYGSSTMCLVGIDKQTARIESANLGDSGFLIIGATPDIPQPHIKYRSSPQEHEFGYPYQMGHHTAADAPEDCMLASIQALPGDIIILGSDGLFDNLFDREICTLAVKHQQTSRSPAPLVRELVSSAYHNSRLKKILTPYSFAASEWFDMVYDGGKPDDITVVVAYLT